MKPEIEQLKYRITKLNSTERNPLRRALNSAKLRIQYMSGKMQHLDSYTGELQEYWGFWDGLYNTPLLTMPSKINVWRSIDIRPYAHGYSLARARRKRGWEFTYIQSTVEDFVLDELSHEKEWTRFAIGAYGHIGDHLRLVGISDIRIDPEAQELLERTTLSPQDLYYTIHKIIAKIRPNGRTTILPSDVSNALAPKGKGSR